MATGIGRIGFVNTSDIADVAVELLTREAPMAQEYLLTGPETWSYDEVCALASRITGRTVVHQTVSTAARTAHLEEAGVPADFAPLLAGLDEAIRRGSEDRVSDVVGRVTGHPPRSLDALLGHELAAFTSSAQR